MKKPEISVLLCVYNGENYLREALESITNQTTKNFEIIIVNDASTDQTESILASHKEQHKNRTITILTNRTNVGLTKSLNIGIVNCNGNYIARHDADDISSKHRLERQLKFAKATGADFSTCAYHSNKKNSKKPLFLRKTIERRHFAFGNFLCHGTFFIKKEFLQKLGGYNEEFRVSQDTELLIRATSRGTKIHFLNENLYYFRKHHDSITALASKKQEESTAKINEIYNNPIKFLNTNRYLSIATRNII